VQRIVEYIDENETIEDAPGLRDDDLLVFDCAFKPAKGTRSIHPLGHIRMMAAVMMMIPIIRRSSRSRRISPEMTCEAWSTAPRSRSRCRVATPEIDFPGRCGTGAGGGSRSRCRSSRSATLAPAPHRP